MTKYRGNALSPADLKVIASLSGVYEGEYSTVGLAAGFLLAASSADKLKSEEYHTWVNEWKHFYNELSSDINEAKKLNDHRHVAIWRRLANTFLNARQYAKDVRRGRLSKSA